MRSVVERAAPKVNLTLTVHGRRPDGYHELESLVVFAVDVADIVTVAVDDPAADDPAPDHPLRDRPVGRHPGRDAPPIDASMPMAEMPEIVTTGPFGGSIAGENLLAVTLRRIEALRPGATARVRWVGLDKRLPIAAGIGGGSSDAAALIRAIARAAHRAGAPGNGDARDDHAWDHDTAIASAAALDAMAATWCDVAARIGADVPVCLAGRAQVMRGLGDLLEPVADVPPLFAVLVNPMAPVPADKTARVFRALGAGTLPAPRPARRTPDRFADAVGLLDHVRTVGNDLLPAARTVVPQIDGVLAALRQAPGCAHAVLSGGGPTCVGLHLDGTAAAATAARVRAAHSDWWVATSRLR